MKITNKKPTALNKAKKRDSEEFITAAKSKSTVLGKPDMLGFVELSHTQEVKLSRNYQSAGASYSVRLVVRDTPDEIKKGVKRAEAIVEGPLADKVEEQHNLLNQLV